MAEREDESEAEAEEALDQASPAAIALALGRTSRASKGIDDDARSFLRKHTHLIELQTEHLHEQRVLQLSHMRWRRFSDRMKALLQVMTAVVGLSIGIGVGAMAWSAANERGLVIESFSVPPDLAQKGLTGQVLASMVLDRLGEMQNATLSVRAPSSYANDWNGDIKVEIPETGVSVGELYRLFVHWLGHQTSISGELYRTPEGLELSARTGTAPAKPHAGGEADLKAMTQAAAEDIYATTQPYRYAIYLERANDPDSVERAARALKALAQSGDLTDRIWAGAGLTLSLQKQGDFDGAFRAAATAIALEPRFNLPYANRAGGEGTLGHDEAALADQRKAVALVKAYGARYMKPSAIAYFGPQWEAVADEGVGDYLDAARLADAGLARDPDIVHDRGLIVTIQALDHDLAHARANAAIDPPPAPGDPSKDASGLRWQAAQEAAMIAFAADDWAQLRASLTGVDTRLFAPGELKYRQTYDLPFLALAMAKLDDAKGAWTMIGQTPLDCYFCVRTRGQIAATGRDWPAAQRWFAEAVRQGPSLPFAYMDWGQMLLAEGDPDGAIAKLDLAHKTGPRFADPLELWGEALTRKGDFAGAVAKFAEADRWAPHWGRNHLRWGEALLKLGRPDEARAEFKTAAALDLSAEDRAALSGLVARI